MATRSSILAWEIHGQKSLAVETVNDFEVAVWIMSNKYSYFTQTLKLSCNVHVNLLQHSGALQHTLWEPQYKRMILSKSLGHRRSSYDSQQF